MISRLLVPRDARRAETPDASPLRLTSPLDERMVVSADLPHFVLEAGTSIPSHLPLGALASRVVVPRDMPMTPLGPASVHHAGAPMTAMDQRIAVPVALPVVEFTPKPLMAIQDLPPVLDPDVLTTGEVNLIGRTELRRPAGWTWTGRAGSIAAHFVILVFLIYQSKLFPYHPPTQEQVDIARNQLSFIYMPPDVRGVPIPSAPPSPPLRIDPRILRQFSPPVAVQPIPVPTVPDRAVPDRPARESFSEPPPELPVAPKPQPVERASDFLRGPTTPNTEPTTGGLVLPQINSPGRTLESSAQQALRNSGGAQQLGGQIPGGGGPGNAGGQAGAGIEMLTPTEGVDFSSYLSRVLASVQRNWYSVMPQSARLGDRGRVVLQFRIMRDGGVPPAEPQLMYGSGREPLDRAAISSIKTSSPFEPLPSAFSSPFIELRFIFLYNLPLTAQ